jgi:potassium efflux system protein
VPTGLTADALNQEILQVSSQLLESSRQAQQEQDRAREIADSLNQLPQQQTDARRQLNEVERRIGTQTGNTLSPGAKSCPAGGIGAPEGAGG